MDLLQIAEKLLDNIQAYLIKIEVEEYIQPMEKMEGSSIGQHTRHLLEFYECFFSQNKSGNVIDYNNRKIDKSLEENPKKAISFLSKLKKYLDNIHVNNKLKLKVNYYLNNEDNSVTIDTCFERELVFLIDHTIHHLAIIKTGLKLVNPNLEIPKDFGDVPSFLKFRR
jgi:uncharacterized damage-inducible protein DinB